MATVEASTTVSFPDDAIEWVIIWHTKDDFACQVCRNLSEFPFHFFGDLPSVLINPWMDQPVWDLINDLPLAHPHCRCSIEILVRMNWNKIPEFVEFQTVLERWGVKVEFASEELDMSQLSRAKEEVMGLRSETIRATGHLREFEYIAFRLFSIFNRLGLPPQLDAIINRFERLILTARLLHTSLIMLESATPYGMIMAMVSLASAGITVATAMEIRSAQH